VTYTYCLRYLSDYGTGSGDPTISEVTGAGVGFFKFNYADRVRNRVDLLLQLSRWETFSPSVTAGYGDDNYNHSLFGLTDDKNFNAGVSLAWNPLTWLTFSGDYSYERHDTTQRVPGGTTGGNINDYQSNSKDEFHTVGVGAVIDVIPKKFDINLSYGVTFGYTTIDSKNLNSAGCPPPGTAATCANPLDKIQNVLQTARIVGRYRLTEKLSFRGGFAYERYNERNFARDPMQPFLGFFDTSATGIQSVWLGATVPNYEAYIFSGFVRYDF
jgi:hypothetical protein